MDNEPPRVDYEFSDEDTERLVGPIISHSVKKHVREVVGIPEGEPVALVVHVTSEELAYNVMKVGFVNVSGRGTLASILDNPYPDKNVGVPSIVMSKTLRNSPEKTTIITFCVPAKLLRQDPEGKYGMWFDNKLMPDDRPELWQIFNEIAIKYDEKTGEPTKYAKDDLRLYPVYIPPKYILGIATSSK